MGHRANYVIREDGELELYYSLWGALTVPDDVFWGPEWAEAFIRQQDRVANDDWLDDIWGEGGVALDKDERVITLFGGEVLGLAPLNEVFVDLMGALWSQKGWQVRWAEAGMPAIAAAVGLDPTIATATPTPPNPAPLDEIGTRVYDPELEEFRILTLVTLIGDEVTHRVSDTRATGMLANGPEILPVFETLPLYSDVAEIWQKPDYFDDDSWTLADEFSSTILVEPRARRIRFFELYANRSSVGFLSNHWKGWDLERFEGGLREHFARLDAPLLPGLSVDETESEVVSDLSEDEVIEQVASALLARKTEAPEGLREMSSDVDDTDEIEMYWVNPEVSDMEKKLDEEERREIFGSALAAMLEHRI